jgi:acylphosphatase
VNVKRVRATVRGIVQGVSFRAATRHEAAKLGVVGWVRNRADGSVELEAQGTAAQVDALVAWCAHGPPLAEVTGVEVTVIDVASDEPAFVIRH